MVQRSRPRVLDLGQPSLETDRAVQASNPTELSKILDPLPVGLRDLTETQLVHRLGGLAGLFWGALHRFTRGSGGASPSPDSDMDIDDNVDLPSLSVPLPQRVRLPRQPPPGS